MARLEIFNLRQGRRVVVTLSRRNLLALLHKIDMPGSAREIKNTDCYEDGIQTPYYPGEEATTALPRTTLVLRSEDDDEHYAARPAPPGPMHPATEAFIASGHRNGQVDASEPAEASDSANTPDRPATDESDAR
jgi:hypothetical protein